MEMAVKGKAKRRHLNAGECDELARRTEGTNALTQPHTVNGRGTRSANRGLYPRTPTKRRKCASASGSPSGHQKAIDNFFSVTRVIRSSPHKFPQPGSSTCTNVLNGNRFPEKETGVMTEDDDDDDDVSFLAPPSAPNPEEEWEEEVDNVSPLAAESMPKNEHGVDHLEGMTAEIFGDDDEFVQWDRESHDMEEEVEALPDAHYGLLGSRKVLLKPEGCMDDLPEEVLRQILCLVTAQDLYRCVSLVCHHWRNIVQDTKFVPFKKQYFRYMMREKETVQEICSVLRNSSITDPSSSQHSIRSLVVLMAQHAVGERVRPQDVLDCVKKHRLFPQAEASIRLRIPDIQKFFNLSINGPNPYAAMAVILILSESVGDVQALVSLLTGCMSQTAITEYFSHMAMMLLAVKRNHIKISSRLHYNIYYTLHLMDNGPFTVGSGTSGRPQVQLTGEQQQILSHDVQKDHVIKIVAFAGTGKTTTLVKYAEQRPHLRFLYVAFNKSVASEAQRRFPRNVTCKTVHSLAFADVGRRYQSCRKLTFDLKPFAINSVLPEHRGGFARAKVVSTTLRTFMASPDENLTVAHVPYVRINRHREREAILEPERKLFADEALTIWNKMKDLNETKVDAYHMTHDGYLKLWQLQVPKPCLSQQYDVLFIDEAQDCTPVILDVFLAQSCGKILVGDPHQQIYTFRGAVNALNLIDHTHIFYLTQSFRFGAEIAYVGATILKECKRVEKILVGGKQKGGVCDEAADNVRAALMEGVSLCPGKTAILSRCNVTVFGEAVRLTDSNPQCRLHFIGGVGGIGLNRILDIWKLLEGTKRVRDPLIRCFANKQNGVWAFRKYVQQTNDLELETKLSIVEKYRKRIPELVKRLEMCFEEDIHKADFILGTVHKAKGLEFDTVMVTDDFAKVPSSNHNLHFNPDFSFSKLADDEWNLLYVAVTRARTSLIITKSIRRLLTVAGEYFLKSEMPPGTPLVGDPLPCCISECPNCTTPGSTSSVSKPGNRGTEGGGMSLYDDLGVGASDTKTEGWSKNFKLLQSQLKVKKAALTQAKTQRMKQTTVLAPVIDLKRGGSSEERQIADTPPYAAAALKEAVPSGFSSGDVLIPLADEYDPMFPNDYEKVVKRHREERQRQRELERQKEIEEREKKRKDRPDGGAPSGFSRFPATEGESDEEEDYEAERRKRMMGGAAIAPPSSLVDKDGSSFSYEDEGRPARGSKAAIPPPMYEDSERPRSPPAPTSSFLANMGGTVAHKIMQKYGFKEGQGLGKHEQGLSTALSVEKTSKRGGKIIIGDAAEKPGSSQTVAAETSGGGSAADSSKKSDANPLTEILKNPTKVVLLRNMVGRGEVDEDLEGETKEECEKYGKVVKCVIFEIAVVPDEDAVRIFLEFERVESAIKAVVDLNGRYFGGRVVKACFYNQDKFRILDLGEQF